MNKQEQNTELGKVLPPIHIFEQHYKAVNKKIQNCSIFHVYCTSFHFQKDHYTKQSSTYKAKTCISFLKQELIFPPLLCHEEYS
jgi:hypothetical protein